MTTVVLEKDHFENMRKKHLLSSRIIWGGIMFMSLVYTMLEFTMTKSSFDFSEVRFDVSDTFVLVLAGVSVLLVSAAWFFPRLLVQRSQTTGTGAYARKTLALVLRLSLVLAITIFGMVVSLRGHNGNYGLPFALIGVLGVALSFPTGAFSNFSESELTELAKEREKIFPPLPLPEKVIACLFLAFGVFRLNFVILGFGLLLLNNRFRFRSPKKYWIFLGAAFLLAVLNILQGRSH